MLVNLPRLRALGVMVFPLAALTLLAYALYGHASKPEPLDWRLLLHAWLALLAYATLAVAALLALFLFQAGNISLEDALASSDNPDELKMQMRGITQGSGVR